MVGTPESARDINPSYTKQMHLAPGLTEDLVKRRVKRREQRVLHQKATNLATSAQRTGKVPNLLLMHHPYMRGALHSSYIGALTHS